MTSAFLVLKGANNKSYNLFLKKLNVFQSLLSFNSPNKLIGVSKPKMMCSLYRRRQWLRDDE